MGTSTEPVTLPARTRSKVVIWTSVVALLLTLLFSGAAVAAYFMGKSDWQRLLYPAGGALLIASGVDPTKLLHRAATAALPESSE